MAIEKPTETVSPELRRFLTKIGKVEEFTKNQLVYKEGDDAKYFYVVLSGVIRKNKATKDGREITIRLATTGNVIGEFSLFSEETTYFLNAHVIQDARLLCIEKKRFEQEIITNTNLLQEALRWVSLYARRMHMKYRDLIVAGKKGGVYSTLIRFCNSYGIERSKGILINFPLTNQELANFAGISREVVNRMLTDLKAQGIISVREKKITVHNIDFLRNEVQCENCPVAICTVF